MTPSDRNYDTNGRTHEPNLRELTADLDGLRNIMDVQFKSLRDLVDERDRLYLERSNAQKTAVDAALMAQKEQTAAAFLASEKAIVKAEDAQREYNVRSNEFRGQLDDQNKLQLPRTEASVAFKSFDEKLELLRTDVQKLKESRSEGTGAHVQLSEMRATQQWSVGLIFSIVASFISIAGLVLYAVLHVPK